MRLTMIGLALVLTACATEEPEPQFLADGSANCNWTRYSPYSGEILLAYNRAYREACLAEQARMDAEARGLPVTECLPSGNGGMICTTK